jgi:hypothetical protein
MSWLEKRRPSESAVADDFLDSYVCWREACHDVRSAYQRWGKCEPPERALAFGSYRAALDREEHAARVHLDQTERLRARAQAPGY